MKKSPSVYTWILLVAINACLFILRTLYYPHGMNSDLVLMFPGILALTALNCFVFRRIGHYLLMQGVMLVFEVGAGCVSTLLYYHNVSSDNLTPAVGLLMTLIGAAIILVVTTVTGMIKYARTKKSL